MRKRTHKAAIKLAVFLLVIPALAGCLGFMGRTADDPEYYVVLRGTDITFFSGHALSAEELAQSCGYDPEEYLYDMTDCDGYTSVELYEALDVTVTADGETQSFRVSGGTVGELLEEAGVTVGEEDILSHRLDAGVEDGMGVRVHRVTYGEDVKEEAIAHSTKYKDSKDLEKGKTKTQTEGRDGVKRLTYRVKYIDGAEASRELVSEEITTEPVDTVILRGTKEKTVSKTTSSSSKTTSSNKNTSSSSSSTDKKETSSGSSDKTSSGITTKKNNHTVTEQSGTITTAAGEELSYSKIIGIKAYAYTYPPGTITASGAPVQVGIVAMLRSTLPQGTHVYVVTNDGKFTYGPAVVGDVPGGDIIDLFFDTLEECYQFGVRNATVYVLD